MFLRRGGRIPDKVREMILEGSLKVSLEGSQVGQIKGLSEVQVLVGINEKVEGFFELCRLKGLTGTQGVCIPRGNLPNLVLDREVIAAVERGAFQIWAVDSIDEDIELLTGLPAGRIGEEGTIHDSAGLVAGLPDYHGDMSARSPRITPRTLPGASRGLESSYSMRVRDSTERFSARHTRAGCNTSITSN
jgi:hypothetical protein